MKFILGTKEKMTQLFDEEGKVYPVTLVTATPATVLLVKTVESDGYNAIQIGFGEKKAANVNKAQKGHFKDLGSFAHVREFRVENPADYKVGDKIDLGSFTKGETIEVTGISKGKGFAGVVKRHGFHGGRRSHGQKHSEREPGSIGGGGRAGGRVAKGLRMAGRLGSDRITVKNLKVISIEKDKNVIAISGAIPGRRGTLLEIKVK